jgi:hypothetical protein
MCFCQLLISVGLVAVVEVVVLEVAAVVAAHAGISQKAGQCAKAAV